MSLWRHQHPFFRGGDWWDWPTPERLFDQHFGGAIIEPFSGGMMWEPQFAGIPYWMRPRNVSHLPPPYERGVSEVKNTPENFGIRLDVSHFKPEEIEVKTVGDQVHVEAKHEEKLDEHGFVQRHFARKYHLPNGVDPETVVSSLTKDGVLTIEAPKKAIEAPKERTVHIETGENKAE
jgi:crystallin alpha B